MKYKEAIMQTTMQDPHAEEKHNFNTNTMSEARFPNGLIFKTPREGAPDFVKGAVSIKREELIEWLKSEQGEWVNLDLKKSKEGKLYFQVNDWKPESKTETVSDDLPF